MILKEEINLAKTRRGGWTKEQLQEWGVSWPPAKGWKSQLEKKADNFLMRHRDCTKNHHNCEQKIS